MGAAIIGPFSFPLHLDLPLLRFHSPPLNANYCVDGPSDATV